MILLDPDPNDENPIYGALVTAAAVLIAAVVIGVSTWAILSSGESDRSWAAVVAERAK